jgi:hypothetical protein
VGKSRSRWQRIRHGASIAWRFRYHLLCAVLALVFWESVLIKPFRVFVVMIHEVCHAAAALITGGDVLEIRTAWEESGHTITEGGWIPVICSAGYLGSALLGAVLIWAGALPQLQRVLLLIVGATTMGMTMSYTPVGQLDFYLGIFGGLALMAMAMHSGRTGEAGAVWLGVMLCLYSLFDFMTDLWLFAEFTDAGILARHWGHPWLAYPIAITWSVVSIWVMLGAMSALVRHERSR